MGRNEKGCKGNRNIPGDDGPPSRPEEKKELNKSLEISGRMS